MSDSRKSSPFLARSPLTRAIHSDEQDQFIGFGVSPDITVSTTFRIPAPPDLLAIQDKVDERHHRSPASSHASSAHRPQSSLHGGLNLERSSSYHYKRYSHPTLAQAEKVLSNILNGEALVYSSGLSAAFAALMSVQPDVIAIRDGYMGCHETIKRYCQLRGMSERNSVEVKVIDLDDCYPPSEAGLRVLVWLETPVNPTGECRDIQAYAKKVRECSAGSELLVDSTFAPPPLSNPFLFGADIVLYSGTKYFGGHSDALCGLLVIKKADVNKRLKQLTFDRTHLGMIPGSLESWLLLRSIKTLQIRVIHQSDTSTRLAIWLNSLTERDYRSESDIDEKRRMVLRVWHSSFQDGGSWVGFDAKTNQPRQMMGGGSPCFSLMLQRPLYAKWLPFCTKLFIPATSLGGVESLIQHQVQSEPNCDPRIVRLSVGLEDFQDLKNDLLQAFDRVIRYERHSKL